MCSFGDGFSQQVGGIQAASKNLFLEGFIPSAEKMKEKVRSTDMHLNHVLPTHPTHSGQPVVLNLS